MGLQTGNIIKIIKGYVRAGLDGKPVINLGSYSAIETVRDDEVIAAADEHGMAMVFTGMRHFRH